MANNHTRRCELKPQWATTWSIGTTVPPQKINNYWKGYEGAGTLVHCWWKYSDFSKKKKTRCSNFTLGIYSKEVKAAPQIYWVPASIVSILIIRWRAAQMLIGRQVKFVSWQVNKTWRMNKRKGILHCRRDTRLEVTMLREVNASVRYR